MDRDEPDQNQLAAELANLQEEVTGLSDEGQSSATHNARSADQVSAKLASAKKVMQLLEKMRPVSNEGETRTSFDTPGASVNSAPELPVDSAEIPQAIGRFEIRSMLGHGGFSLVFKAHDPLLNRIVALKVPTLDSLLNPDAAARFEQESRVVATLSHPNIVPVFEVGKDGPIAYIATAYVEGTDLSKWVYQHGTPAPRSAATVVSVIAEAIQHAHSRGVIHRDLKPANILVEHSDSQSSLKQLKADSVHVADFGLAKMLDSDQQLTQTGNLLGTPAFAAPEQLAEAGSIDKPCPELADVYSMGAILYFLLTGKPPHTADKLLDLVRKVKSVDPVPPAEHSPEIPVELSAICMKAMEKAPTNRYQSAYALGRDLQNFKDGKPVLAKPIGSFAKTMRWCQRNPVIAGLSVVALASILVGTALALWSARNATIAAGQTRQQYLDSKQVIDEYYVQVSRNPMFLSPSFREQKQELLGTAKRHYNEFLKTNANDESLLLELLQTEIYLAQAEFEGNNYDLAGEKFEECLADCEKQLKASPNDPQLKIMRAVCLRGMGTIAQKSGNAEEAELALVESAIALETIKPGSGDNDELTFQLIQSWQSLVNLHRENGQLDKQFAYSKKQQELLEERAAKSTLSPILQNQLAMSLGDQSLYFRDHGQPEKSLEYLNRSIEISNQLVESEPNPIWFAETGMASLYRRAVFHFRSGRTGSALEDAQRCSLLGDALAIHNRTAEFADHRISHRNLLASCLKLSGEFEQALGLYRTNVNAANELTDKHSAQVDYKITLAISMLQLHSALTDAWILQEAWESSVELADWLQKLKANGIRRPVLERLEISNLLAQGRIKFRQLEFEESIDKYNEAEVLLQYGDEQDSKVQAVQQVLASICDNRSWSYLQAGEMELALSDRRRSMSLDQTAPQYQALGLAETLARVGKKNEALELLEAVDLEAAKRDFSRSGLEVNLAFVHGAIAAALSKQLLEQPDDEAERLLREQTELAAQHFLKAVDLGYFDGKPENYFGIILRPHLWEVLARPPIKLILDKQKAIWESR